MSLSSRLGTRLEKFPGILGEIAEAVGEEAALAVAEARGGTLGYFPGVLTLREGRSENNWLIEAVGIEAAIKIAAACSPSRGVLIDVPLGPLARDFRLHQEVDKRLCAGENANEIARALKITRRAVLRRKAKTREKNCPDVQSAPEHRTACDVKTRGIER